MSNIGKKNIKIPENVSIIFENSKVSIEGKLGKLEYPLSGEVLFSKENDTIKSFS